MSCPSLKSGGVKTKSKSESTGLESMAGPSPSTKGDSSPRPGLEYYISAHYVICNGIVASETVKRTIE